MRSLLRWCKAVVLPLVLALCLLVTRLHGVSGGQASSDLELTPQAFLPLAFRSEPPLTFAVMADTHSGYNQEVESYQRNAVARIRAIHPPFFVVVGDLVHDGADVNDWYSFSNTERALMAESTIYPALGNHEKNHANYFNFFQLPNNERWYSWDYKDAHFIVLELDGYASVAPGSQQYNWLRNDLSSTAKTWKFVFFHIPLYSCGLVGGPDKEARAYLHPLFEGYGVDIVFSGHDHNYQRHVIGSVTYIVTGGGGMETWGVKSGCYNDPWPAYWEETRHVVEVVVSRSTVTSTAIRPDGSRFDQFSLTTD